ncbi:alpha/beta hydrolase [Halobacteriales archaeon QS_4_62_28]|nr:MAG: alpha/beta hydrolase [Halobacteriales archaeon QS_4_62_28]
MESVRTLSDCLRQHWKRPVLIGVAVVVIASVGGALYFSQGFHGTTDSIEDVRANENVSVGQAHGGHVLTPTGTSSERAVIFYPGARVEPDAYLATFAPVVERSGVTVYIPDMPLNVGVLGVGTAGEIQAENDAVEHWYVGGHSLGGVAACRYAANSPGAVDGLVLFASYCDVDLSPQSLAVLSVTGSRDTVLDREAYAGGRNRLPADAQFHEIDGVNHSQFGSYRGQRGDSPGSVGDDEAHDRIAAVVVDWLANETDRRPPAGDYSSASSRNRDHLLPCGCAERTA